MIRKACSTSLTNTLLSSLEALQIHPQKMEIHVQRCQHMHDLYPSCHYIRKCYHVVCNKVAGQQFLWSKIIIPTYVQTDIQMYVDLLMCSRRGCVYRRATGNSI